VSYNSGTNKTMPIRTKLWTATLCAFFAASAWGQTPDGTAPANETVCDRLDHGAHFDERG
jgi:hypothetical protein